MKLDKWRVKYWSIIFGLKKTEGCLPSHLIRKTTFQFTQDSSGPWVVSWYNCQWCSISLSRCPSLDNTSYGQPLHHGSSVHHFRFHEREQATRCHDVFWGHQGLLHSPWPHQGHCTVERQLSDVWNIVTEALLETTRAVAGGRKEAVHHRQRESRVRGHKGMERHGRLSRTVVTSLSQWPHARQGSPPNYISEKGHLNNIFISFKAAFYEVMSWLFYFK